MSIIYMLVNSRLSEVCKVGKTRGPIEKRIKGIINSNIWPYSSWEAYSSWEVNSKILNTAESNLHKYLENCRDKTAPGVEIYSMCPFYLNLLISRFLANNYGGTYA